MKKQILFLHGFMSANKSHKAQTLAEYVRVHDPDYEVVIPNIQDDLHESLNSIISFVKENAPNLTAVVGSSLGGYWAYRIFKIYKIPTILLNPVVDPINLLDQFAGKHINPFTNVEFEIDPKKNYADLPISELTLEEKKSFLVFLGTKDEVLDYHKAEQFYAGATIKILENEDHRIKRFDLCCSDIMNFINK